MSLHARIVCKLLAVAACATAVQSTAGLAVDKIRYVSITGVNTNDCTLTAPCRTLQRGINATPAGGELRILDSGDYGNVTNIGRSMTISGNGNTVILANPIVIDNANAVVTLRGLTLNGEGGTSGDGIRIIAAAAVHIERCVIHGFFGAGIGVTANGVELSVLDSVSRHNAGGLGISVGTSSRLRVDNSRFDNNRSTGIFIGSGNAKIYRSTVSRNRGNGITIATASVSVVSMMVAQNAGRGVFIEAGVLSVESSVIRGMGGTGLFVNFSSIARISNSTITANATGIDNNGGVVQTRQNNTIVGNTTNLAGGALTPIGGI